MNPELPSAPLQGISSPLAFFPEITSAYDLVSIIFTVIFILWALYTLIAAYHWLRFARNSWIAVPAVGAHLFVSAVLMIYATSGFN
ncbi:MAG TPA: hypothetical protein VNU47_00970 [Candidatus Paceibacterota bacterium]|nr:hypothetical protein [Candidatus Paceibacterota bacterium]